MTDKVPIHNIFNNGLTNTKNNLVLNNNIGSINNFNNIPQGSNLNLTINGMNPNAQ